MTATFTDCYIIDDGGDMTAMTLSQMIEYVTAFGKDYGFYIWHIQADAAPRNVTNGMLDKYAPLDDDEDDDAPRGRSAYDEHAIGWENV